MEEELIEKIKRLGQQTLSSFGQGVEKEGAKGLRSGKKGIHQREKKLNLLQHFWRNQNG